MKTKTQTSKKAPGLIKKRLTTAGFIKKSLKSASKFNK